MPIADDYKFSIYFPSPELSPYIQYYGVFEFKNIEDGLMIQEIVPTNLSAINFISAENTFYSRQNGSPFLPLSSASLVGHITQKVYNKIIGTGSGVVVIFTSYGLFRLFGINMHELTNAVEDAADFICTKEITECRQKLFEIQNIKEKISVIESFLLKTLHKSCFELRSIDKIIDFIQLRKGNVGIEWLSNQANMSFKTFERHFDKKIGMSPKLYADITRFSNAVKMLSFQKNISAILNQCGYTDHAHMIKEFRKFTGDTPRHFYKENDELSDYFLNPLAKNDENLQFSE